MDIFLTIAKAIEHYCRSRLQLGLNRGEIEALPTHVHGKPGTVAGLPQGNGLGGSARYDRHRAAVLGPALFGITQGRRAFLAIGN